MSADLEATLLELGPEACDVVVRLRNAVTATDLLLVRRRRVRRRAFFAAAFAASLLLVLGFGVLVLSFPGSRRGPFDYAAAYAKSSAAHDYILKTQQRDGSWANDFLTRQNAAVLENFHDPVSQIAYRRAVRYLQQKGLAPFTSQELNSHLI